MIVRPPARRPVVQALGARDREVVDAREAPRHVPGLVELWESPLRASRGVYLWCFELDGALLVNYVGKAGGVGGFETRLWTVRDPQDAKKLKSGAMPPEISRTYAFARSNTSSLDPRESLAS